MTALIRFSISDSERGGNKEEADGEWDVDWSKEGIVRVEPSDLAMAEPLGWGKGTADRTSGLDSGVAGRMSGSEASPFSIDGFCDNITVSGGDTSFVASDGTGVS